VVEEGSRSLVLKQMGDSNCEFAIPAMLSGILDEYAGKRALQVGFDLYVDGHGQVGQEWEEDNIPIGEGR
jgi:hypothetical protein